MGKHVYKPESVETNKCLGKIRKAEQSTDVMVKSCVDKNSQQAYKTIIASSNDKL
jgi:hypothetical protein